MGASRIALKEWAVVCEALADGTQLVLFRKGGIHEGGAGFRPEHEEFWLFPTGFHQSLDSVREPFRERACQVLENPPPAGKLPFRHFCRVRGVCWCDDEKRLDRLLPFQILERDALMTRFHYRRPGLFLLRVDVRSLPETVLLPADPAYDGCHSWVELKSSLATDALSLPAMMAERQENLEHLLTIFPELESSP